jgi:hypothetical protein
MNYIAMLALLKALTQEVNLLELELAQLEASSSVAVATTTPIVFPTWTPTNQRTQVINPAPFLGSVSQATSTPDVSISSISLTASGEGYVTSSTIFTTNQNQEFQLRIYDSEGQYIGPAQIVTDDVKNGDIQFSEANEDNVVYAFEYQPPTDGLHVITINALQSSIAVTIESESQTQ